MRRIESAKLTAQCIAQMTTQNDLVDEIEELIITIKAPKPIVQALREFENQTPQRFRDFLYEDLGTLLIVGLFYTNEGADEIKKSAEEAVRRLKGMGELQS